MIINKINYDIIILDNEGYICDFICAEEIKGE